MATRRRAQITAMVNAIGKLDDGVKRVARRIIEDVGIDGMDVLRDALVEGVLPTAEVAASSAAELGASAYNTWRAADLGSTIEAVAVSKFDTGKYMSAINAAVKSLADGGTVDDAMGILGGRIGYTSRASCYESIFASGRRDPVQPKYARVPEDDEACDFCLMLASTGFVASKGHLGDEVHAHANCRCTYVASWDKSPKAQGYDSAAIYNRWMDSIDEEAEKRAERNGTTVGEERKAIMKRYADSSAAYKRRTRDR